MIGTESFRFGVNWRTIIPEAFMQRCGLWFAALLVYPLLLAENLPVIPGTATATAAIPADMQRESALYLQRRLGAWTFAEARAILGAPLRQRPAFDEGGAVSGTTYAFPDPTNRYKELELSFDRQSGRLESIFVYPFQMTWQECKDAWGANVMVARTSRGRVFYSYLNRQLDVLVDSGGSVISIGLY